MADRPVPPPGSPGRARHRQLGDALLTLDGRVTETPAAKTIATDVLAARMRSSTPAMVLASLGLNVGTEMMARLGDPGYVLVPLDPQYPSKGAQVLHRSELDRRRPTARPVPMDGPDAEPLIRRIAVSELMGSWAYGAENNSRALALQLAAAQEFGLTEFSSASIAGRAGTGPALELMYNGDVLRDFVRTQHTLTQEVLAAQGITHLLGYRAATPAGSERQSWGSGSTVGTTVQPAQLPLARWSADRAVASGWVDASRTEAVVAAEIPARDVVSLPTTGMGFLDHRAWVALPGDRPTILESVVSPVAPERVTVRGPDRGADVTSTAPAWHPLPIGRSAGQLTGQAAPDELDARIGRILDGVEEAPAWWPQDDSGYAIARRDLEFLGIAPVQLRWMVTGAAPMGMTPPLYAEFCSELVAALERDGVRPSEVDIRLKGTSAGFFSGLHKTLPRAGDLGDGPAADRLRAWFGDDPHRPVRRPYDAMWRLGLEAEPSDFDLDLNSTAAVRAARMYWRDHVTDRYPGDFMGGHGYLDKKVVLAALPALGGWAGRWSERLGRPISLGVFESAGPFDETVLGRELSSHFKDSDWVIHRPGNPRAWESPHSRVTDPLRRLAGVAPGLTGSAAPAPSPASAAPGPAVIAPGPAVTGAGERAPHLRRGGSRSGGRGRG